MQEDTVQSLDTNLPLHEAIKKSIADGKIEATKIRDSVDHVVETMQTTRDRFRIIQDAFPLGMEDQRRATAKNFIHALKRSKSKLEKTWTRRSEALENFNIVMFGRTGVGKSTLIDALSHGDGQGVSQGESDWTVDVRPVQWQDCQLIDTPGINGWGRTERRADLEAKAHKAVETADIVLLCFDTQNQQESEFTKVAEWVQAYGKPAIAIINNGHVEWRNPVRQGRQRQRAKLSRDMQQHESNVKESLEKVGFQTLPIVCLNSKRALMARASLPFHGPYADDISAQREKYGQDSLLRWSNLPALEALLSEALSQDAPKIRLGMMAASLRGDFDAVGKDLTKHAEDAKQRADMLDKEISALFKFFAYPMKASSMRAILPAVVEGVDCLDWLEDLRGGQYAAPSQGEFDNQLSKLLENSFGAQRAASIRRAEEVVIDAFEKRTAIDGAVFQERVFKMEEIEKGNQSAQKLAHGYIKRNLSLIDGDAVIAAIKLDFDNSTIFGDAADDSRNGSNLARIIKVGVALAAIPVGGWTVVAASLVGSWLFGHVQKELTEEAEATHAKARRDALSQVRTAVNEAFDHITQETKQAIHNYRDQCLKQFLVPLLFEAGLCHRIIAETQKINDVMETVSDTLGNYAPADVLLKAAKRVEERRYPAIPKAARLVWAGEDWITDPVGLTVPVDGKTDDFMMPDRPEVWRAPAPDRDLQIGMTFVKSARNKLLGIADTPALILAEMQQLAELDRPNICLVGDYNTGKTSLIRRLLAEAGMPVPENLEVRADPTTQTVTRYDCGGAWLIDTPGFRSMRGQDDERATSALQDASLIIWLMNRTALDTSIAHICQVMEGDRAAGLAGKGRRTLLVIGRSDELGADPIDQPAEFDNLCSRKKVEVSQAFAAKGVEVLSSDILVISANPYSLVHDELDITARDFDSHRSWDGMADLLSTLSARISDNHALNCIDAAAVDGGLARLATLDRLLAGMEAGWQDQVAQIEGLNKKIDERGSEVDEFRERMAMDIDRMLDEVTQPLLAEFWGAKTPDEQSAAAKVLEQWWEDPVFRQNLSRWEGKWQAEIESWMARAADELQRGLNSKEMRQGHFALNNSIRTDDFVQSESSGSQWFNAAQTGFNKFGDKIITRDNVYSIGKAMGVKFKPWGATKLAGKLSTAAPKVLGAAAVLFELWSWNSDEKKSKERDEALRNLADAIQQSRNDLRLSLLGQDDDPQGVAAYLSDNFAELMALKHQLEPALESNQLRLEQLADDRKVVGTLIQSGWAKLNSQKEEEILNAQ